MNTTKIARKSQNDADRNAKKLKDLGNKLFAAKKYDESIRVFSEAITCWDSQENPLLRAMCFQNRAAAKEHHGGFSIDDMVSDCEQAIKCNPKYAKAYFRKARLLEKKEDHEGSLISVFCATQIDPSLDAQSANILTVILEHLEKNAYSKWLEGNATRDQTRHVRHEKVYSWLHKTVSFDCMRTDVLSSEVSGNTPYEVALQLVRDKDYDRVADKAMEENGDKKLNALILAARFYFYRNQLDKFASCIGEFDALYQALPDEMKEQKKDLLNARHVVSIEAGRTSEEVMKAFNKAVEETKSKNPDFNVMAGFRLVLCNDTRTAKEMLSSNDIQTPNMKLLYLTLQILCTTGQDGAPDMAQLHNNILELEKFVSELEPKTGYALSLLAKITATFSMDSSAQQMFEEVFKLEPAESIHFFDRSCVAASGADAIEYLKKCLEIEPHHAEAHLMLASLLMNEVGTRPISEEQYNTIDAHLSTAATTFADNVDFPVVMGVFRLREILLAKKKVASVLSS
ncbi:unnamed protein product [Cylicocyclus nassatus]|uniref:Mitochondrial import receptor subunit TOM70 n=1 Tax=Cylicocyclus nassatus TaxID=53992 RepID=A0AA36HF23_CYLNA|nr:unnamed protein product [Cylicocyclus nassatus]